MTRGMRTWVALLLATAVAAAPSMPWAQGLPERGDAAAQHQRGLAAFHRGDVVAAMALLRSPAQAGHAPSQVLLAYILDRADFAEEAVALYRDAAAQGAADGHLGLAQAYLTGRGIAKDEKLALQHFSKAADGGQPTAIEALADAYIQGRLGLADARPEEALAAVRRAAEGGHLVSIDALAQAHRTGRWSLPVDAQQAAAWQNRAAQLRTQRAALRPGPARKAP